MRATAQLQVLNKILINKDISLITLNNLSAEYFYNYDAEYKFIMNHYNKYKVVPDQVTILNSFPNFDIITVSEPDNYLLDQLIKEYNRAYMVQQFNTLKPLLENNKVDEAVNYLMTSMENIQHGSAMTCTDLIKDTSRFEHYIERTNNLNKYYISTGFPELDKLIGGIDTENENMVIAARTGIGKSWTLIKMAAEASAQGKTVGIYSGEMATDKVGYRIDTILANKLGLTVKNSAITRGFIDEKQAYENYLKKLAVSNFGPIKVITPNDIAGPATVDALRAFIEKEHLDILFVDQYSLLEDTSYAKQGFERVANISKAIKQLQVMKQIPIISVAQMNRTKADDKDKSVQDTTQIGLSDRIGQDATVVLMLDKALDSNNDRLFNMTINVIKSRDGGDNRKIKYNVDFNEGIFTYIPNENDGIKSEDDHESTKQRYSDEIIYEEGAF